MKSLVTPESKTKTTVRGAKENPKKESNKKVAQCCAKISKVVAGCHD